MESATNPTLVFIAIFVGVFVASGCFLLAASMFSPTERAAARRVSRIRYRFSHSGKAEAMAHVRRIAADTSVKGLELFARRLIPRPAELRKRLSRTGYKITFGQYVLANSFVLAIASGLCFIFFNAGPLLTLLVGVVCGLGLPHYAVGRLIKKRLDKFTKLFPEAIDLIVRGLKSGLPITESIANVGQEIDDPIGIEFRRIADGVRLGKAIEESLADAADRLDTAEFKFFVISIGVQKETGGNLADTLENLSDILRRRLQMKLKIKAMSSEARASAIIIGSLPFLLFGVLMFMNYGYVSVLFTDPRGMLMGGAGLVAMGLGLFVINRMIQFEI